MRAVADTCPQGGCEGGREAWAAPCRPREAWGRLSDSKATSGFRGLLGPDVFVQGDWGLRTTRMGEKGRSKGFGSKSPLWSLRQEPMVARAGGGQDRGGQILRKSRISQRRGKGVT